MSEIAIRNIGPHNTAVLVDAFFSDLDEATSFLEPGYMILHSSFARYVWSSENGWWDSPRNPCRAGRETRELLGMLLHKVSGERRKKREEF
jgi:hypothetical protein